MTRPALSALPLVKLLAKSPYEGRTHWLELDREKP